MMSSEPEQSEAVNLTLSMCVWCCKFASVLLEEELIQLGCTVGSGQGQSRLCLNSPYFSLNIWSILRGIVGTVELGVAVELCQHWQGLSCHCGVGPCKAALIWGSDLGCKESLEILT